MAALVEADESNVSLDVHHMVSTLKVPCEAECLTAQAAAATQVLVASLFELPATRSSVGPIARLPAASLVMPREKPCPEKKGETKWEKFAKEKGIQKKKKSRMEWDEDRDKWAPSWGYDKAGSAMEDAPIIEVKGDDIYADPRAEERKAKKDRVAKNEKQREKNEQRAKRAKHGGRDPDAGGLKAAAPPKASDLVKAATRKARQDPDAPEGLPVDLTDNAKATRHKGDKGVAGALARAQRATASLGNFDAMVDGEKARPMAQDAKGRKRKFKSLVGAAGSDADRGLSLLRDLERPRAEKPKKGTKEVMDTHDGGLPNSDGFKRKKGRAGGGKMKKVTKARTK